MVLVSVLWISGIMAAFAISVTLSVRSHALFERNAVEIGLAQGIADGLVRLAALAAAPGAPQQGTRPMNGEWQACRWSDRAQAWISVQDQGGLVDLNTASMPLMEALFMGLGLAPQKARDMASAIRDFRDRDGVADFGASEADAYAGLGFGPKNAPFEAVEELDRIPGMTPALFDQMKQLTTVGNMQSGVNFRTAPPALLVTLARGQPGTAQLSFAASSAGSGSIITAAVQLDDGTRFVRRALVMSTGQPDMPFVARSWESLPWPPSLAGLAPSPDGCLGMVPGASGGLP